MIGAPVPKTNPSFEWGAASKPGCGGLDGRLNLYTVDADWVYNAPDPAALTRDSAYPDLPTEQLMTSGGAEALKAAIRRSLFLIVLLVVLGVLALNAFKQLQGPQYGAAARVLVSTTPLSQIITGTEPAFVDPQRIQDTAQALAGSPQVYERAAVRTQGSYGTASELKDATRVTAGDNTDLLTFTATSSDPDRAIAIANAVASAFVAWRANLVGETIRSSADELRYKLASLPAGDPARTDLRQQLNRLELLQSLNGSDTIIVTLARSAGKSSPAPIHDSLLGASIGLVIAFLVVAAREAIDTTIRSEGDVEDLLSAPVLATVRSLPRRSRIVTYGRHEAAFGDTYALLAANLTQARGNGQKKVVLAVTSALSREGKTTTAANLAVALARRGTRVLLADFDFRKPALASLFDIPRDASGAVQILSGDAELDGALWRVSLAGSRPRVQLDGSHPWDDEHEGPNGAGAEAGGSLHVLPAGDSVRTQAIAQSPRLAPLLKQLRTRAEYVIIDTPPALLTVEMAELSRLIDHVLVVVRQGRVTQRSLRSLGRQARTWPAELAGAVVTDAPGEEAYAYYGGR